MKVFYLFFLTLSLFVFDAQSHINKEAYYKERIWNLHLSCDTINHGVDNRSTEVRTCYGKKIFSLMGRLTHRRESDLYMVMADIFEDCRERWNSVNCYSMNIRSLFENWDIFFLPEKEVEEVEEVEEKVVEEREYDYPPEPDQLYELR